MAQMNGRLTLRSHAFSEGEVVFEAALMFD
jgi:hypothetical protein